jgi:immune inhibitor A
MTLPHDLLSEIRRIHGAARSSDDGQRCAVAPSPELRDKINKAVATAGRSAALSGALSLRAAEPKVVGLNDGVIIPPEDYPLGTSPSVIRSAALDRSPLRGTLRVIVVLVDFSDKHMTQTQNHYRDLFFSTGVLPTKSVREYYNDVTNGLIDIQGDVVGPFRLPQTLATYAHGASGLGSTLPNATTMARDAVVASDPTVNFSPYDNDGNGYVDAFIVIHAGPGAEVTGSSGDIWSHKWTLDGGAKSVDTTKIYGYLTVPEDCKIGVCAHELGHLLFGFPDLYDTDGSSEGIGNWCLMAAGSWGGGGDTPVHPSAWCKANQGWASVDNRTTNGVVSVHDVKDAHTIYRLWKNGAAGNEYFLVENRQQAGFDASLPGPGLLIWHIDESVTTNTNESHYKVALMQADGKRDLELNHNRGDAGDPFPGSSGNTSFNATSNPNSKSYANATTCVAVTGISASAPIMTANMQVQCKVKVKDVAHGKEFIKEKELHEKLHPDKNLAIEKPLVDKHLPDKQADKPVTDKTGALDKGFADNKLGDNKLSDGRPGGGGLGGGGGGAHGTGDTAAIESRVAAIESALGMSHASTTRHQPFIGSELRPDLSQGSLLQEDDYAQLRDQMKTGSAAAKRMFDSKPGG